MANTKEEKIVRKNDLTLVEFTEKASYQKKGVREYIATVNAEKFVKNGIAKIVK